MARTRSDARTVGRTDAQTLKILWRLCLEKPQAGSTKIKYKARMFFSGMYIDVLFNMLDLY